MKRDDVVLITGASAGIGEALAVELSSRGLRTALLARRTDRTERLAARLGGDARSLAIACDVTVEGALDEAVALTLQRFGRIDAVVANAGFGVDGALARLSLDDYRRQFETNVFGVLRTAMATRAPLAATRGVFAAVGSVSAYVSAPGASAYNMSKGAVRSLCETLNAEWAPAGVAVVHIAPGFVSSEIRKVDRKGQLREGAKDPVPGWLQLSAEAAAREIADALSARRAEAVITGHGKALVWLSRRAPAVLRQLLKLMARQARPSKGEG